MDVRRPDPARDGRQAPRMAAGQQSVTVRCCHEGGDVPHHVHEHGAWERMPAIPSDPRASRPRQVGCTGAVLGRTADFPDCLSKIRARAQSPQTRIEKENR